MIFEFINPAHAGIFIRKVFVCFIFYIPLHLLVVSTVSEPGLVTRYSKWAMGWKTGESDVDLPMVRDFPPTQSVRCGSGSTHTSVYCSDIQRWYAKKFVNFSFLINLIFMDPCIVV